MRFLFLLVLLVLFDSNSFCQCINNVIVKYGGEYDSYKYIFGCPSYTFAIHGDTSKNWGVLNDPIDIKQAPAKALVFKRSVENAVRKYAGESFFSNIKFIDVQVVFPDSLNEFKGRSDVTKTKCLATYFYHYQFKPDSVAFYLIGIAVDSNGKILSRFEFPSKKDYKPINRRFSYCTLIETAKRIQKGIDPIQEIQFNYNQQTKSFYWLISRGLVTKETHEGVNYIKQVVIDAADLSKAKAVTGEANIIY